MISVFGGKAFVVEVF